MPGMGVKTIRNTVWKFKLAGGILVSKINYPYDDIPGESDLHLCRQLVCGLIILSNATIPTGVYIRGVIELATSRLQLVPEVVIGSARDGSYGGNLNSNVVWDDI